MFLLSDNFNRETLQAYEKNFIAVLPMRRAWQHSHKIIVGELLSELDLDVVTSMVRERAAETVV